MRLFIPDNISHNQGEIANQNDLPDPAYDEIEALLVDEHVLVVGGAGPMPNPDVLANNWKFDPYNLIPCDDAYPTLLLLFVWGMKKHNIDQAQFDQAQFLSIIRHPRFKPTICQTTKEIAFGIYGKAYDTFRQAGIPGLDRSIASIYLHYCSNKTDNKLKALVFDEEVARALYLAQCRAPIQTEWLDYCNYLTGLTWNNIAPQFNQTWHTNGYLQYLILLHAWAQSLGCEAFQIELWLSTYLKKWPNGPCDLIDSKTTKAIIDLLDI